MTREETGIIMDILSTAYPSFYAGKDAPDPRKVMALWSEMFAEDDVAVVAAAVKTLIACDEKGFPPHIGAVKARMRQITEPDQMTEQEAWALVSRAVRNGIYGSEREFEALPEAVQRIVGSPAQLREWAMMDADTVSSVVSSNFQRSYRARAKHEREFEALPSDVKVFVAAMTGGMGHKRLETGGTRP